MRIQAFRPELAVEAFDERLFDWLNESKFFDLAQPDGILTNETIKNIIEGGS